MWRVSRKKETIKYTSVFSTPRKPKWSRNDRAIVKGKVKQPKEKYENYQEQTMYIFNL